jgi:hypothetical protein
MVKNIKRLIVGASVFASVSAIASAPAFAGSIKNTAITGTAPYFVYDANSTNTFLVPSTAANVSKVLDGNSSAPTGNVELFSNSETLSKAAFAGYTGSTSLEGSIGGKAITLSSLTFADWNTTVSNGKTLGQKWFGDLLVAYNLASLVGTVNESILFNLFVANKGLQRFSDPNISYVNQDDQTGLIRIGLAGHLNAASLLGLSTLQLSSLGLQGPLQASELVKVSYNGQTPQYLYSFSGTNSGLVSDDGTKSHNGNYEVTLQGDKPSQSVPEPSSLIGLVSLGGLIAAKRKLAKQTSAL